MNDNEREEFRRELLKRLPPDCRTDAANKHVAAMLSFEKMFPEYVQPRNRFDEAYYHFLAGWDAAMELRLPELLDEHTKLHGEIMDRVLEEMLDERKHDG